MGLFTALPLGCGLGLGGLVDAWQCKAVHENDIFKVLKFENLLRQSNILMTLEALRQPYSESGHVSSDIHPKSSQEPKLA